MSTHNIGFNQDLTKVIFQLSSYTHLISSSAFVDYISFKQFSHDKAQNLI